MEMPPVAKPLIHRVQYGMLQIYLRYYSLAKIDPLDEYGLPIVVKMKPQRTIANIDAVSSI